MTGTLFDRPTRPRNTSTPVSLNCLSLNTLATESTLLPVMSIISHRALPSQHGPKGRTDFLYELSLICLSEQVQMPPSCYTYSCSW